MRRVLAVAARSVLVAVVLVALAPQASAAPVVVKAARMLDVTSGKMVADPVVVVDGGRIVAAGSEAAPAVVPKGAEVIDLGDRTLLPGLIDSHTHLAYQIEPGFAFKAVTDTDADYAYRAAANARKTVEAGFTTVREVGSTGFVDVALSKAVEQGLVEGPHVIPSGYALSITGGHCDTTGFAPGIAERSPRTGVADGPWEAVEAVRYQIKHGAKWIKVCATAGVLSFEGPVGAQQFSAEELGAIVQEAARHGVKVAAHAHGADGIEAAVRAGVASIEHGSELTDEIIALMKERGTYLVPTTYLADAIDLDALPAPIRAKAEHILPIAKESLRKAIAAGVPIAFGTDAGVYPHGDNAKELASLVERGMTPLASLQSATLGASDLLGLDDRGRIEKGRLADLIAVEGDPLGDITTLQHVEFVMVGGRVVKPVVEE